MALLSRRSESPDPPALYMAPVGSTEYYRRRQIPYAMSFECAYKEV